MSDPTIGEVRMFAGSFAPLGWMFCNGQLMSIAENSALFSLLGTMYGGDGVSTFAIPDLRGRTPIHAGQGQGLSNRDVGEVLGNETVTLTPSQMPAHYHAVHASTTPGTDASPTGNLWASGSTGERQYTTGGGNIVNMSAQSTTLTGGSQPHDNMMPFQTVAFIIAVEGIYPSRN